jgi:hypothetical protein
VEVLEQKQVQFEQILYMMYQFHRYNELNIFHYDQVQLMEYEVYVNDHQFEKVLNLILDHLVSMLLVYQQLIIYIQEQLVNQL